MTERSADAKPQTTEKTDFQNDDAIPGRTAELIHAIARFGVAFIWLWHGTVPKLITRDPVEIAPLLPLGFDEAAAWQVVTVSGIAEILFGLVVILAWGYRLPFQLTIVAMLGLLFGTFALQPQLAGGAFNPVTLNITVILLSLVGLLAMEPATTGGRRGSVGRL